MKHFKHLIILLLIGVLGTSCAENGKKLKKEIEDSSQIIKNSKSVAKEAAGMQENMALLRDKDPLSKEQFKSWLPDTLLNLPLTSSMFNIIPEMGSCGGTYHIGNKRIRVMVIDGAGEKGAGGVGPYRMSSKMDYDTTNDWGYTKTRMISGIKVKESYNKGANSYNLSLFYGERFAVDIKTNEIDKESLDKIVRELNLIELKNL
ncbi:MAG: hypothetical protein R3243_08960 [Arenibacter latericius]|nr:hypothetical protein [Arenibacter latericius]